MGPRNSNRRTEIGREEHTYCLCRTRLQGFHEVIELPGELMERLKRIAAVMFDNFHKEYSYLVRDLEHIKLPENRQRIETAFATEIFIPLTALMDEAIRRRQLHGDPRFLAQVYGSLVDSFIARADEFNLKNEELAKQLVAFFLRGAA